MQSGRVLDKGEHEVTPYYSTTSIGGRGGSVRVQTGYGVIAGVGLAEQRKADLRVRYELIEFGDYGQTFHVLSFGPKFRMGDDNVAFYLPVGSAIGDDIETSEFWEVQPTFLMTSTHASWLEVNSSAKGLIRFADEPDPRVAFNLGMALGPDPRRLAIRPEAGVMFGPGTGGFHYHFSIGLSVGFGESRSPPRSSPGDDDLVGGFAINDLQFKASYREVVVTGEIVNRTGIDRALVRFEVLCTDPLGGVLATTHFELSGLADDAPRRFEVRATGTELDRVSRCRVRPADGESPDS